MQTESAPRKDPLSADPPTWTSLPGRPDRAGAAEAQAGLGGRGEVELAVAGVRPAIDDRHADGAPAVAQRDLRAAGQRLVGDAERPRRQRPAAGEVTAVQAGAVPRGDGGAVHAEAPDGVIGAGVPRVAAEEHAQRPGAGPRRAVAQRVAAAGVGAIAVEGAPALAAAGLQDDGAPRAA